MQTSNVAYVNSVTPYTMYMKGVLTSGKSATVELQWYILDTNTYTIASTVVPSIAAYYPKDPTVTITFNAFTPSDPSLDIIYWLENSDGTAYDASVFTFADATAATSI